MCAYTYRNLAIPHHVWVVAVKKQRKEKKKVKRTQRRLIKHGMKRDLPTIFKPTVQEHSS